MRLLKTHSHTFARQGYEASKVRQTKKERTEGLAVRDRKKSSTKAIAIPPATGVGQKLSTEKRKVDTKSEAVLCPSMPCQLHPDHPQLQSWARFCETRRKITRDTPKTT